MESRRRRVLHMTDDSESLIGAVIQYNRTYKGRFPLPELTARVDG